MHGGKLNVIAVQRLLDHGFVKLRGMLASGVFMAAFCLGGDRHEKCSSATG